VCLLAGTVRTNQDYGLGHMERLPDAYANAPTVFEAVELLALTFFALHSFVRAGGFSEEDLPICFMWLRLNLMVLFSQYNCNNWTGRRRCSYIQHAQCKDLGY
jgi:hypothetical protein